MSRKLLTNIRSHTIGFLYYLMAVLVAISIPIFTSQLEKARESTDLANLRGAYAEQVAALLTWDGNTTIPDVTITAKQTQDNWQSDGNNATTTIGSDNGAVSVTATDEMREQYNKGVPIEEIIKPYLDRLFGEQK